MLITKEKTYLFKEGNFNHCSCCCPLGPDQSVITWYSGTGECRDDQAVNILLISGHLTDAIRLGPGTGNPIIWKEDHSCWLVYSRFESVTARLVDRWKTCSLWVQEIGHSSGGLRLIGEPRVLANADQHLLARCRPITINHTTYLPLYDEVARCCVLYAGKNGTYVEHARFGRDVIQPTIWTENKAGQRMFYALCRNFGNNELFSQYYYSDDGIYWLGGSSSEFFNVNNSIHAMRWGTETVVLWNNCTTLRRANLTLGNVEVTDTVKSKHLEVISEFGCYPSLACDDEFLYFTFTNTRSEIEYHVWNRERYERSVRGTDPSRSRRQASCT